MRETKFPILSTKNVKKDNFPSKKRPGNYPKLVSSVKYCAQQLQQKRRENKFKVSDALTASFLPHRVELRQFASCPFLLESLSR